MTTTPNIGTVGAAVTKSTNIQSNEPGGAGNNRKGFQYAPTYNLGKTITLPNGQRYTYRPQNLVPKDVAKQPQYNLDFSLPYAQFNKKYLTPDYTPSEFLALTSKGYVGAFTNNNKTVLATMGPAYSTQRALWDLRAGRKVQTYTDYTPVNEYGTHGINIAGNVLDAAKVPTMGDVSGYVTKAVKFTQRYGADGAKYVKQYGHMPSASSSYGDLFAANTAGVVQTAVDKFQKDNYDAVVTAYNKEMQQRVNSTATSIGNYAASLKTVGTDASKALALQSIILQQAATKYSPDASKTGKGSMANIAKLQTILGLRDPKTGDILPEKQATAHWDNLVRDTINSTMGDQIAAAKAGLTPEAIDLMNVWLMAGSGGLWGAVWGTGNSTKVLTKMTEMAAPGGLLAPSKLNTDNPLAFTGDLALNAVKSVARMSTGMPMGFVGAVESLNKTFDNISAGNFKTGDHSAYGIDTTLIDAFKADYVRRYKTPFDTGFTNAESWKKFGTIVGQDPVAPILDVLSVVPMIGAIAKGADIANIIATGGRLTDATAADYARVNGIIAENAFNPVKWSGPFAASDVGALRTVTDAQKYVDAINGAKVAIKAPTFAKLVRRAHLGDTAAISELDRYRKLGLVIPQIGKEASWTLRNAARFEERTKEMLPPARAVNYVEGADIAAIRRLPASPIARGLMEGTMIITRGLGQLAEKVDIPTEGRVMGSKPVKTVTDILMRIPHSPYNWQYSRALKNSFQYYAGDLATSGQLAHNVAKFAEESGFSAPSDPHGRAILALLGDGNGGSAFGRLSDPAYQRTILNNEKIKLQARADSGEILHTNETFINDMKALNERLAALPDQAAYESAVSELTRKLENPKIKISANGEKAFEVYNKMQFLHERVIRLVHGETPAHTVEYLQRVYREAFTALNLLPDTLFGTDTAGWAKGGELYPYRNRVLIVNDNFPLHEAMNWSHEPYNLVLPENSDTSVFEAITDPATHKDAVDSFMAFMKAIQQDGVLRDAAGSPEANGRPVIVLAKGSRLTDKFVQVHVPRLSGGISDAGVAARDALVNTGETFTVPRELFSAKAQQAEARIMFEEGALNAAHDYYPSPQFFSDKINEAGLLGEAKNFAEHKNEGIVATLGLKDHSLRTHILSQKHYLRNRYERDLLPIAEANAEMVPMADFMGGKYRGGYMLKGVHVFDNLQAAEDFAKVRGISVQFRDAVSQEASSPGSTAAADPFSVEKGFGTITHKGQKLYVVKGNVTDYAAHALRDTTTQLRNHLDYRDALYETNPDQLANLTGSHVLVVPHHIDRVLKETVAEGNDYASQLLTNNAVSKFTSLWKRFVLFSPRFIGSNVLGGSAMYMLHNPLMAGKLMLRMLAYGAKKAGDTKFVNIANEGAALAYHMAYETSHNVFQGDAGIKAFEDAKQASRAIKYGWNGGYTVVAAFEHMLRTMVAKDFLLEDPAFKSFMTGPEVKRYIENGVDFNGTVRSDITPFEAATDLMLDPASKYFNSHLKTRMRYTTNTVSGNYHSFSPAEQLVRNFLMPFYSWQRHSLAFTWRLPIDKPITANVLNNVGQYGYAQTLQNGLPSWMDQTVPMPQVIEDTFGISHGDHRIDLSSLNPFSTTADMATAVTQLIGGNGVGKLGPNFFNFTHPILNGLIKSTLNIDPQTGTQINPADQSGFFQTMLDTMMNTPGLKIPKSLTWDMINGVYSDNALANKYKAVDASAILRNYDPHADPKKAWSLYIPNESSTVQAGSYGEALFNVLFPVKQYSINEDRMGELAKKEAVAAGVLKAANDQSATAQIDSYVKRVDAWRKKRDYVMQVWLPLAQKQNVPQAQIALVLSKLEDEKGKAPSGLNFDNTLQLLGG
jgi:hypothetical protein